MQESDNLNQAHSHNGSFKSTSWRTINTSPSGVQKQNVKTHFKHSKALLKPEKQNQTVKN